MKNIRKYNYLFLIGIFALLLSVSGCKENSDLGIEVLPKDDLISIKNTIVKGSISSSTFREDSIRTGGAAKSLIGSFNDPVFGITNIDFATQFRLQRFPDYGVNPVADSVKLYLYYRIIYGDTITPQKFKVYELETGLDVDSKYNQSIDLKSMASNQLLGEIEYTPRVRLDSTTLDTFYQLISIPLDITLAEKFIQADSLDMINNDVFLEYFKGLLIETEQVNGEGGTILSLEAASNDAFQGSAIAVYYSNDEVRDISQDSSLVMPFVISKYSARVNSIKHDYTGTPFEQDINAQYTEDTLFYVQPTGGLKGKILIDNLESWRDSVNTAINKAELVFQIDTIASDVHNFMPPTQLLFTVVDSIGREYLPIDYVFSPSYYGGRLYSDYTYRFNITQHLQEIIKGSVGNFGFFLTPANKNSEANRVVLKGSNSETGVKLIITYAKYNL